MPRWLGYILRFLIVAAFYFLGYFILKFLFSPFGYQPGWVFRLALLGLGALISRKIIDLPERTDVYGQPSPKDKAHIDSITIKNSSSNHSERKRSP